MPAKLKNIFVKAFRRIGKVRFSLLAVTEEHLSTLLLCRKKIRQSNRRTSVHFITLSTFHTLYLFDKTAAGETCQRERKDESGRPEDCRWEVKKAG